MSVPGFIDDLTEHIIQTAPYPEKTLAFGSALTAQAFLASRKIRDETGSRSNLYVIALANSGAGKDWPRKIVKNLFLDVGLVDNIGDSLASGEGLEDLLFVRPAFLLQADEFHALLAAIKSGHEQRYEGIANVLLKMFGSSDTTYAMRARAGRPTTIIDQPGLSIFGTSIPAEFYESLSPRMLSNGLFARLLILEAGKRGAGQLAAVRAIPDSIKQTAKWWAELSPGESRANLAAFHPTPLLVPIAATAQSVFADLRADADRLYNAAESRLDAAGMAVWTRCAKRLGALH